MNECEALIQTFQHELHKFLNLMVSLDFCFEIDIFIMDSKKHRQKPL